MKIVGREVGPILSWLSRLPVPASLNQSNGINSINFLGISWKLSEAAMKMSPASLSIVSRPPYLLNASVFVVVTIPIISSSHFPSGGGEMEGWSGGGGGGGGGGGERKARHMANVWFPYSEFNGGSWYNDKVDPITPTSSSASSSSSSSLFLLPQPHLVSGLCATRPEIARFHCNLQFLHRLDWSPVDCFWRVTWPGPVAMNQPRPSWFQALPHHLPLTESTLNRTASTLTTIASLLSDSCGWSSGGRRTVAGGRWRRRWRERRGGAGGPGGGGQVVQFVRQMTLDRQDY